MKTNLKKKFNLYGWVVFAMVALSLNSCTSDDDDSNSSNDKTLSITIHTNDITSKTGTRTTDLTSDPETTEKNIKRVTVGVFGKSGAVKTIQEFANAGSDVNSTYTVTASTSFNPTDQVLIAVNAPAGTFNKVSSVADFNTTMMSIATALTGSDSGTQESSSTLPMFGMASSLSSDGSKYTVSVDVHYLVAKIMLSSLSVNFATDGGYLNAKFTPTQVFLTNVPANLYYSSTPYYTSGSLATDYYDGEYTASGTTTTSGDTYAEYLGTNNALSSIALSGAGVDASYYGGSTSPTKLYFYTMPNSSSNTAYSTRLVIKGTFDPDGTGSLSTVYYPVIIKDGTGTIGVKPGYKYSLSVIIKTIGSKSPIDEFDSGAVDGNITVQSFEDAEASSITFE